MNVPGPVVGFLEGSRGQICTVMCRRAVGSGSTVLIAPPFGEEMNKTRKMLTEVAGALQVRGVATLVVDLHGAGDSAGASRSGSEVPL